MTRHPPKTACAIRSAVTALLPLVLAGVGLAAATSAAAQVDPDRVEAEVARNADAFLTLYRDLLALPNDAHHPEDIVELVAWLESAFEARGFRTTRLPTPGSPLLLAERGPGREGPTTLVYLQADGQPVDTVAWSQPDPYRAVLKARQPDGTWTIVPWDRAHGDDSGDLRVFARSASDSKGPIAQFLAALDVMDALDLEPATPIKVIVDTQEEQGSPHLPAAVREHRDRLAADQLVIFDGPPHSSGRPTLTFGARGILLATLTTYGPVEPQHSGHYGNYLPNPAFSLARALASVKDAAGRVTIPGWYDGIRLDPATRRRLAAVPDREDSLKAALGVAVQDSVAPTLQEAIQYPSLNVRGMRAGWVGTQARTIIPSEAVAELDIRLVVESDGARLVGLLTDHLTRRGFTVLDHEPSAAERTRHPRIITLTWRKAYDAFRTPTDSPTGRWLAAGMRRAHGVDPILIRTSGGSVPIAPFVVTLGVPAVIVPTVNPDNNQHSPDENLRLREFFKGITTIATVLTEPLPPGFDPR